MLNRVTVILCLLFLSEIAYPQFSSPVDIDLVDHEKSILVTDKTGKRVMVFDRSKEQVVTNISLESEPTGSVVAKDGKTVYITAGSAIGTIFEADIFSGQTKKLMQVGHGINSPVLSKDETKLYVCSRFDNTVKVIDLQKNVLLQSIPVMREPVAGSITPDGKLLYVANHMPDGRADLDYVASKISVIDTEKDEIVSTIKLVNGAEGMRDVTVSPDGRYVFATHLMARFQVPTTQIEHGWINTNALSVVRTTDQKLLYTVLLDDVDQGFANPWALDLSNDGKHLCVSSAGNHELRLINLNALTHKIEHTVETLGVDGEAMHLNAHNDLSFVSDVSQRVLLKGLGPRALVMTGNKIYAAEYFSESIGIVELDDLTNKERIRSVPLKVKTPMTKERQGEIFFNDASLCFQQWQSCASCHSDDGRVDALNWDLLNDGIGNPKNVKSLLYSHQTPPVMSLGVRHNAEMAVRAGIKFIQFAVRPEEDAEAIDAYLKSLKPVPSPKLVDGSLSEPAKRGKKHFESLQCANCHPSPLFTNLKSYNFGTGKGPDEGKSFDTSTLIEVWRTSPYWHDGRAATLEEAIKLHYPNGLKLNEEELKDLAEYVGSL